MQAPEDLESQPGDSLAEHLVILCTGGAGRTSIEALRPEDGLNRWWFELGRTLDGIAVADGTIFAATRRRSRRNEREPELVFALRARDRTVLWRTDETSLRWPLAKLKLKYGMRTALGQISIGAGRAAAKSIQLAWDAGLVADGDMLFVCSQGATFALDARSGAFRWFYPIVTGFTHNLISAHGGRRYVRGDPYEMVALEGRTGKTLWHFNGMAEPRTVLFDDAHLYAADDRAIVILRAADGTLEHTYTIQPRTEAFAGLRAEGVAYLMRSTGLHAVRLRDNKDLWHSAALVGAATQEPYGLPGMAQVNATGQHVYYAYRHGLAKAHVLVVGALEAETGRPLWQWRGPEVPFPMAGGASLAAALGHLYLSAHEGTFAFDGDDGHLLWQLHPGYNDRLSGPCVISADTAAG